MVRRKRRRAPGDDSARRERELQEGRIGEVLLDLRSALLKAQRCRVTLTRYGLSHRRWLEIVRDIDPNLRFMARPQEMDAIVVYLESAGRPVEIEQLVTEMSGRGVATIERIRQIIRFNVQTGKLKRHGDGRIGLPKPSK